MRLTVVIVNHRTDTYLEGCLASLFASDPSGMGVVVVENHGRPLSDLKKKFPVRVVGNPKPQGFAANCNQVLRETTATYALLLNPDTLVKEGCLIRLLRFMDENETVAACGPRLLTRGGAVWPSGRSFPDWRAALLRNTPLQRLFRNHRAVANYLRLEEDPASTRAVDWISGAAMMLRMEVVRKVGFLDERFFMYCEDMDLCFRLKKLGWRIFVVGEAEVVHFGQGGTNQQAYRMILEHHRSMWRYWRKHAHPKPWIAPLVWSGIQLRCLCALLARAGLSVEAVQGRHRRTPPRRRA